VTPAMRSRLLLAMAAAPLLLRPVPAVQAQAAPDPTPGTIGLLVLEPITPAIQSRLIQGLASDQPPVRAAAARVAFTLGMRGLLPQILIALSSESDGDAALEMARFVAGFGSADDPVLVNATTRVNSAVARQIVSLQARARAVAASATAAVVSPPPSTEPSASLLRLASGYPRGFVTSVLATARCDVANQKGAGAGARVSLRPDGRVARLTLLEVPPSKDCARAAQALMLSYVAAPGRAIGPNTEDMLAFPFVTDFAACQDTSSTGAVDRLAPGPEGRIIPPTQTKKVQPHYPESAQKDKTTGIVIVEATISPTGCVQSAAVLRSRDLRLDWAALRAIVQWQYTPTLIGGNATPVVMTVTVTFNLN
jgi:TonB family protein